MRYYRHDGRVTRGGGKPVALTRRAELGGGAAPGGQVHDIEEIVLFPGSRKVNCRDIRLRDILQASVKRLFSGEQSGFPEIHFS